MSNRDERDAQSFRDDITCPVSGDPIPLNKLSVSKWSDQLYRIFCPACGVWHDFTPTKIAVSIGKSNDADI